MSHAILSPEIAALRQKPPFLFVERIEGLDRDQGCIVALLSGGNGCSFTSSQELPAYILLEALAQTGGLLLRSVLGGARRGYIAGFEAVRFGHPSVASPAPVHLQAQLNEAMPPFYSLKISACRSGQMLAKGTMRLYAEV